MSKKIGKAMLPNLQPIFAAGINPKTGLPIKAENPDEIDLQLRDDMIRLISKVDEQDAVNRYTWYNLPGDLTGQMMEEILYTRGQAMFFYYKERFFFLPYALDGTIDVYGRYTGVTPVPIGSTSEDKGDGKPKAWIQGKIFKPIYEVLDPDNVTLEDMEEKCVLLKDHSNLLMQNVTPRSLLNRSLIETMGNIIPYMNTALSNSTGVTGMRIPEDDAVPSVMAANSSTKIAALSGQRYIPITGTIEFQELASGSTLKTADFMQCLESLDNYRLSLYGIENGGLFQKKSHMLQEEQALAGGNVGLVMQDGLTLRQEFCNRVNSIWPLGIWCEVSETVAGIDKDLDGEISDEQDGQIPADNIIQSGGEENAV